MDKKKISLGLRLSALWLAIMTLFMGFGAGLNYKDAEGTTSGISNIFDYTFGKGEFKYLKDAGYKLHNAGLIIAFVLVLIAIIALIALIIMNAKGAANTKTNIAFAIVIAVMLVVAAILYFCAKAFAKKLITELGGDINEYKLGAGAICSGLFGLLGAGSLVGSIVIDK